MTEYRRRARHQDRPQPGPSGIDDRRQFLHSGLAKVIRELDDEDPVLRDQPDQRDEADLAIDVHRREAEEREEQGAADGERSRAREDDEGIAEALELGREHQEDQNRREQEDAEEPAAFRAELAGLARVVDREALGQYRL